MAQNMAKLIVLYKQPSDAEAFDRQYFNEHVPLAEKIPGLRTMEVMKVKKNLTGGDSPYMIATLTFSSMEDLKAGLASDAGKAAGANVMGFAGDLITMLTTEVAVTQGVGVA